MRRWTLNFMGWLLMLQDGPENRKNALDAQILVYNGLCVLRQQLTPDVRIHSFITDGGTAPNVIPDFTKSKYDTRAAAMDTL
ncbi:MAG: amidohydrolase, partial [Stecheria intestinalis]|nr:amidohydrolase [Stecheria intestinalis]